MTPEENRARVRAWQQSNPEKANAKAARYYQRVKDAKKLKSRIHYRENMETPWNPIRDVTLGSKRS
jgi:hypothetical protein